MWSRITKISWLMGFGLFQHQKFTGWPQTTGGSGAKAEDGTAAADDADADADAADAADPEAADQAASPKASPRGVTAVLAKAKAARLAKAKAKAAKAAKVDAPLSKEELKEKAHRCSNRASRWRVWDLLRRWMVIWCVWYCLIVSMVRLEMIRPCFVDIVGGFKQLLLGFAFF